MTTARRAGALADAQLQGSQPGRHRDADDTLDGDPYVGVRVSVDIDAETNDMLRALDEIRETIIRERAAGTDADGSL